MVPGFSQTTRAMRADRGVARVWVGVFIVLLVAWGAWMALGSVTLYETADLARVQAEGVARLRVPVAGRVQGWPVRLGDTVDAGAILLSLDATEANLEVAVAKAELASLVAQRAVRVEERDATGASREASVRARAADQAAARAALAEAQVVRDDAQRRLSDAVRLHEAGAESASAVALARSDLAAQDARVAAMRAQVLRSTGEASEATESGSAAEARERQNDQALEARVIAAEAAVLQATEARNRHVVHAPIAGTVGELPALVPGQQVDENTLVAVVVPDSELVVEARFVPQRAAGRLVVGQTARVRIVGAGGQGVRPARVREVGSEPGADGRVPVVLELASDEDGLHHGLVAEVEVEVESVSPLTVLLRAAGQGE